MTYAPTVRSVSKVSLCKYGNEAQISIQADFVCSISNRQYTVEAYGGRGVKLHAFWPLAPAHTDKLLHARNVAGLNLFIPTNYLFVTIQLIHHFCLFVWKRKMLQKLLCLLFEKTIIYFDYQNLTFPLLYISELWAYVLRRCTVFRKFSNSWPFFQPCWHQLLFGVFSHRRCGKSLDKSYLISGIKGCFRTWKSDVEVFTEMATFM